MIELKGGLWVGSDEDHMSARNQGLCIVTCEKYGPYGHAQVCGYRHGAAPPGPERLWAHRGDRLILNVVDTEDPHPDAGAAYSYGVIWATHRIQEGREVLIHCNKGLSRAPSVATATMVQLGWWSAKEALKKMREAYPQYAAKPGVGLWLDNYLASCVPA